MELFFNHSMFSVQDIDLKWSHFGSLQAVICSRINCRVVAMDLRAHGKHYYTKMLVNDEPFCHFAFRINMQLFIYVVSKFLDYTATDSWSLYVFKTFNSQIKNYQYAKQNSEMCFSFLICRWLQSEKPWWSLSRHDGQVSRCMWLSQGVHTHCKLQILEDCRTVSSLWLFTQKQRQCDRNVSK